MYPQGPGMSRQHNVPVPGHGHSPVQGIPGMPSSAVMSTPNVSSMGLSMHQGFSGMRPEGSSPLQLHENKLWKQSQHPSSLKLQDSSSQQMANPPQHQKEHKHRDYLKQQQRLKAMPLSSSKALSADALIGNLLGKKDTFTLRQNKANKQDVDLVDPSGSSLQVMQPALLVPGGNSAVSNENFPGWLSPNSPRLPPIYSHIWSLAIDPTSGGTLVDTNKILALLLTSGLPKEVLGFIWNLATNGASVQLSQHQLYVTLALVALAQMGCTFNNLNVLNLIPTPPIPTFNMNVPKSVTEDKLKCPEVTVKTPASVPVTSAPLSCSSSSMGSNSSFMFSSQPSVSTDNPLGRADDDDFADDFSDFQSADTSNPPLSSSTNLCSALPSTAIIQPSVTAKQVVNELNHSVVNKLSRSHGRSIGSRLANYSLGAPKSNTNLKLRRASGDHDNSYIHDEFHSNHERNHEQDQIFQEKSESEDFSDFQIADGLKVNVDDLFPKCHPKPKGQDSILKESPIRNDSDDDDLTENRADILLALDSPTSSKPLDLDRNIPSTLFVPPVVPPPPSKVTKELMLVEEDKYSALRMLELESTKRTVNETESSSCKGADADDFGDFVSADDLFAEIADRVPENKVVQVTVNNPVPLSSTQNIEFPIDEWGIHSSKDNFSNGLFTANQNMSDNQTSFIEAFSEMDISKQTYDPLPKVDSSSQWSFDLDIGKESKAVNFNLTDTAPQNDDDFGDFIGPDTTQLDDANSKSPSGFLCDQLWSENSSSKLPGSVLADNKSVSSLELSGVELSRHGSLPSLDLNLSPASDDTMDKAKNSQVLDWIRCLESSLSLLQDAANTFTKITSQSVVMEVVGSCEGRSYLKNLLEVHRVTWRLQRSYQRSGHESNQIDTLNGNINVVWSTLQTFYKQANIETAIENDGSDEESGQPACGVCGSPASRSVLEYGGHVYHAPCANLWLNCVDRTLPAHSPLL